MQLDKLKLARVASGVAILSAGLYVFVVVGSQVTALSAAVPPVATLLHLMMFLVVAAVPAPEWARASGYGWLVVDNVAVGLASHHGAADLIAPVRLAAHSGLGLWLVGAAFASGWARRWLGGAIAVVTIAYAAAAPLLPESGFRAMLPLFVVWLLLTAVALHKQAAEQGVARS